MGSGSQILSRTTLINIIKFIKLLRIEPYLFLHNFQNGLKLVTSGQLVEDKICMGWYNGTAQYCHDVPSSNEVGHQTGHYKSTILAEAAQFGSYNTYITTIPGVIWALFIGAWIDRYIRARKTILLVITIAISIELLFGIYLSVNWNTSVYYNLLLQLPSSIFGGSAAEKIAFIHYMSSTTPHKLLAIRFMIFEIVVLTAATLGEAMGGYFLVKDPFFGTGEIRNYTFVFILAFGIEVLAILWIIFMINEKIARKQELKIEMKLRAVPQNIRNDQNIELKSDRNVNDRDVHPLRLLFDINNLKSMVKTALKFRTNKVRIQLIILYVSMVVFILDYTGGGNLLNQFFQVVYFWTPDWISYMNSLSMIFNSLVTLTIVPVLTKVFKVGDIPLAIIGFVNLYLMNIIQGSWLNSTAFYVFLPFGAIGGIALIGIKSHMTKIVDRDEIGKIISFMLTLETLAPLISSTVFTKIFSKTIDTYPGSVYQLIAGIEIIPILMLMWIDIYTERPLNDQTD